MRRCQNCAHLIVPPDADGKVRRRRANAYRCGHTPEMPVLSAAVTNNRQFAWPPHSSWMTPDQGDGCPAWRSVE